MDYIAYNADSAFSAQVIYEIDNMEDRVLTAYVWDGGHTRKTWSKLRADKEGNTYFYSRGIRWYICDFIRRAA